MMRQVTTTIVMLLAGGVAAAQTTPGPEETEYPRYTVEVIIFEYAEEVSVGTEQFLPDEPPLPAADDAVARERVFEDSPAALDVEEQERRQATAATEFVLHAEDELTMNDIAARLERLDVYRPVMHFAWTQATRPEDQTQPIELRALSEPPEGLDGSFTLYLSRYLHLVVDLSLEQRTGLADPFAIDEPVTVFRDDRGGGAFDALQPGPVRFRISEDRIFKSGDLRYFDHPKFGVLAKITRVEEAEDDEPGTGLVGQFGQ